MFIRILPSHYQIMLKSVDHLLPEEACGLLAGEENTSVQVYQIENMLHSPVKFMMEPKQQLNALIDIEQNGWDLLAIYHSHPNGPPIPSKNDVLENFYPDTPYLIWYREELVWFCRAFLVRDSTIRKLDLEFVK